MNIINKPLPKDEYRSTKTKKTSICIHHTAGGHNPLNVISAWDNDTLGRVATPYIIGGISTRDKNAEHDGLIYQCFSEDYDCSHIGKPPIDFSTIGIEVCNYGYLTKSTDGKYYTYVHSEVPEDMVYTINEGWKGYKHFHKYTTKQIASLKELLLYLSNKYNINIKKQWIISKFTTSTSALKNESGLWTHVNYRKDKTDMHPQPELIEMVNLL